MMWDTSEYELRHSTEISFSEHSHTNNGYNVNSGGFLRLLESVNSGEEPNMVEGWQHKETPLNVIGQLITNSMDILQNKFISDSGERYIATKGLDDEGQGHYVSEWSLEGQQFLYNEMQQHWQQENSLPSITDTAKFFTNGDSPVTDDTSFKDITDFDVQMWPCVYTNDAIMPINNLDLVNFISDHVDLENLPSSSDGCSDTWEPTPIFRASDFYEGGLEDQEAKGHNSGINQIDHEAQNVSAENNQHENDPVDIRMMPCIVTSSFVAPLTPEDISELIGTQTEIVSTPEQNHEEETQCNSLQLTYATIPRFKAIYESSEQWSPLSSTSFNRFKGKPDTCISSSQCSSVPRILTPDRLRMQEALNSPSITSNEDTNTKCGQDQLMKHAPVDSYSPFTQSERSSSRASSDISHFRQLPTSSRTAEQYKRRLDGPSQNLIQKTIVDNSQRRRCATPVPWLTAEENENLRKSKITNEWSTTLVPWITNVQNYWKERDGFRQPESVSEYLGRSHLKQHQCSPETSTESFVSIADELENRRGCHEPFHVPSDASSDKHSSEYQLDKRLTVQSEVSDLELSALYAKSGSQKQYTELTNVSRCRVFSGNTKEIETANFPEFQYHRVNVVSSSTELFHGCPVSRNYMIAFDQNVHMPGTEWSDGMEEANTEEQSESEFMSDVDSQSSYSLENTQSCGSFSSEMSSDEPYRPFNNSDDGDGHTALRSPNPAIVYTNHVGTSVSDLAPFHIFIGQTALIQARPITHSAGQNSNLAQMMNSKDYSGTSRGYYSYGDTRTKMIPIVPEPVRADNQSLRNVPSSSERRNKRLSKNKTNQVYPGSAKLLHICNKLKKSK